MVLPAGGFLTLGFILLAMGYFEQRKKAGKRESGGSRMNDQTLFSIFFSAMVVNNFTLAMFLGLCPFMGVSARVETALRMGLANIFVLVLTSLSAWVLNTYILETAPYPANHLLHHRGGFAGADRGDGGEKIRPRAVPPAGHFPAADDHQLRDFRPGHFPDQPRLRISCRASFSQLAPGLA